MVRLPPGVLLLFNGGTRWRLAAAFVGSIVVALVEVVAVLAVLPLVQLLTGASVSTGALGEIDSRIGGPDRATLGAILAGVLFAGFLLKALVSLAYRWWVLGFIAHQEVDTSVRVMRHLLRSDYAMHVSRSKSDMIRAMSDSVSQLYNQGVVGAISVVTEAVTLVALTSVLLVAAPVVTLAALAYFALAGWLLQRFTRPRVARAGEVLLDSSMESHVTAMRALDGIKESKIRNSSRHFVEDFRAARVLGAGARRHAVFFSEMPRAVLEVLFIAGVALISLLLFTTRGQATALALLALVIAAGFRVLPSLARMLGGLSSVRIGMTGYDLVVTELQKAVRTTELDRGDDTGERLPFTHWLRLDDLSFRYGTGPEVVRSVSLDVPAGTITALVGSSGAGKTTLVDLVLGLHQPTSGRILADGVDVAEHLQAWQHNLAMVPQEVVLFDADLATNIAFDQRGDEIDRDRVAEVVEQAQLSDLVQGLPHGLDTVIGGAGVRLSGGQKQRVGIARALYRRPHLLVLDEATSALDNLTEHRISRAVDALRGETTVLVVAHRLSTVRSCDLLVFMRDGRVAAQGTFDEVRRSNAEFARLVELGSLDPPEPAGPGVALADEA